MTGHLKVYKLPVELNFRSGASIYLIRLAILLFISLQILCVMLILAAVILLVQSRPQLATVLLFLSGAVFLGYVNLSLYRLFSAKRVKTAEDVEQYLGLSTLASIPYERPFALEPLLIDSSSSIAEAYRHLRTALLFSKSMGPPKTILITSSVRAEGVTTTAFNLGTMLTLTGGSVLLIDCNMRRPRLHTYFGISNTTGLSNLLAGMPATEEMRSQDSSPFQGTGFDKQNQSNGTSVRESEQQDFESQNEFLVRSMEALISSNKLIRSKEDLPGLFLIPSGPVPPDPDELLGSSHMQQLLNVLSKRFSYIILDVPPLNLFTDGLTLATLVDGTVLVINSGQTLLTEVEKAKNAMRKIGAKIFGVVLSGDLEANATYYSSY